MRRCYRKRNRSGASSGFTLVELLVVITIIAILAAIAIPSIGMVMDRARNTTTRMEILEIEKAVNSYANEYGDLPPDGSSWVVMNRHLNKAFPRISAVDRTLLYNMCHEPDLAPSNNPSGGTFSPVAIDRAECIVLFLGGLSADETRPFTGPGGPFQLIGSNPVTPTDYQYNIDRNSPRMEFETTRLTISPLDPSSPVSSSNRVVSSDDTDLIPIYFPKGRSAPYIYFDSRTYGYVAYAGDYNGFNQGDYGEIRPYKTKQNPPPPTTYSAATVPEAYRWQNPDSFQIISAGADDMFGNLVHNPLITGMPAYFLTDTGEVLGCDTSKTRSRDMLVPNVTGFQERSLNSSWENNHLDNITNFSEQLLLEDNLP